MCNMESFERPPRSVPSDDLTIGSIFSGVQSAKALDEKWSRYLSLQELILVVPRTQDVQTSLAINWPCAAGIDVVSLDRRTPANEKKVRVGRAGDRATT
jgi:hypothetical protein